ncbi:hypothetical protein AB0J82_39085 [Asanoa sp. NPDC049518]|uniref:anti-phage DNA glycosylase Brig1 n=1 Tax=unclassified Asanoa TaxID=2685164 RepID=UPI00341456C6
MSSNRQQIADFWDQHVDAWLAGDDPMPDPLPSWYSCYAGKGVGASTREGFPEPYIGDLRGVQQAPRMVVLGLNPGAYRRSFQSRDGIFAKQIASLGSFSAWSRSGPYHGGEWDAEMGPNRFHRARVGFARNWLNDPAVDWSGLLVMELYPWHSTSVTASMTPPSGVIDTFVWQPLADLDVPDVFAFGRPWQALALSLGLRQTDSLGAGGRCYGSGVESRAVRTFDLPSGQRLVVEWHSGSAGPPSAAETALLRQALTQ